MVRCLNMRNRLISICCWIAGIILAIALYFLAHSFGMVWLLFFSSIVWAAVDCKRIRLWHFYTGISCHPTTLILLMVILWPIVFPWYLAIRFQIAAGTAKLREDYNA